MTTTEPAARRAVNLPAGRPAEEHPAPALRPAYIVSAVAAVLMTGASAAGLWIAGFYPDIPWAAQALRGGDLVTLCVGVPLLAAALVAAARGSQRARLVWAGALGYAVYNYAYVVFGAEFNDLFLVHVAILSLALWALIALLPALDVAAVGRRFGHRTPARSVAVLFGGVTLVLTGMWSYFSVRQAITGELPGGAAPPAALHMVYATDLTFFVVPLAVTTVLLWRRTAWGHVLGTVMAVMGGAYLINLMSAAAFQARAHVEGVAAFSWLSLALDLAFVAAALAMLASMAPRASATTTGPGAAVVTADMAPHAGGTGGRPR